MMTFLKINLHLPSFIAGLVVAVLLAASAAFFAVPTEAQAPNRIFGTRANGQAVPLQATDDGILKVQQTP